MQEFDLIIAGAGASGLMAACAAGARGLNVLVLEHNPEPGRKLLLSGGGRCNITNRKVDTTNYISENPQFCRSALKRFSPENMLGLLQEAGIPLEERDHGQIFCRNSARDTLDWLTSRCQQTGCTILCGVEIEAVELLDKPGGNTAEGNFHLYGKQNNNAMHFHGRNLLLATGGPSFPQCGGSDAGMRWAKAFGHSILPPSPALVPLAMPAEWPLRGLEGISLDVTVELLRPSQAAVSGQKRDKNNAVPTFTLHLLFTHKGLSGPAVLQISSYWRKGDALRLNFLPEKDLLALINANGKSLSKNFFCRLLPERLAKALLPTDLVERKLAELARRDLLRLQEAFQAHIVYPVGSEGMRRAEASRGGVNTAEVSSSTMESRICPGLYFAGEVLDVCGQLGGYNLHWAWASGVTAGNSVA